MLDLTPFPAAIVPWLMADVSAPNSRVGAKNMFTIHGSCTVLPAQNPRPVQLRIRIYLKNIHRARRSWYRTCKVQALSYVQGAGGERDVLGEASRAPFIDRQGSPTFVASERVRRLLQKGLCMYVDNTRRDLVRADEAQCLSDTLPSDRAYRLHS